MKRDIDFLFEVIYNNYIYVFNSAREMKRGVKRAFFVFAVALFMLGSASAADLPSGSSPDVKLDLSAACEGQRLTVNFSLPASLCGFMGALEYDGGAFSFEGVRVSDNSAFCFDCAEREGEIVFILDAAEPSTQKEKGETLTFFFNYLKDEDEMFAFSVRPIGDAYRLENQELFAFRPRPFGVAVVCDGTGDDEPFLTVDLVEPRPTEARRLKIRCSVAGTSYVFCGLEVSLVQLDSLAVESCLTVGALPCFSDATGEAPSRTMYFEVDIPDGNVAMILTPSAYDGDGERRGEKAVYCFFDGDLAEY